MSTWRVSFEDRITGQERPFSWPKALKLAVLNMKYLLLTVGSSPSQRDANTLMKCPLVKTNMSPGLARTRLTTRSARALAC
jgi:hypothetical protein